MVRKERLDLPKLVELASKAVTKSEPLKPEVRRKRERKRKGERQSKGERERQSESKR